MTSSSSPIADAHTRRIRYQILRNVLVHRRLTRREIGDLVSLSGGAITHHTRWLLERRLVRAHKTQADRPYRPVEELSINGTEGQCLTLAIEAERVTGELVCLEGSVLHRWAEPVSAFTQAGVFRALERAAARAHKLAERIDAASLMVAGLVSPEAGLIFHVEGIEGGWEACQPGHILEPLRRVPGLFVWTDVACKVRGLGGRLRRDDAIAYFEQQGQAFRVANMEAGRVHYGTHGTQSALLHQRVADDGPACYCGVRGCLAAYLRQPDDLPHDLLARGLKRVFDRIHADAVGLEWNAAGGWLKMWLEELGVEAHPVDDGARLASEGLRLLAIEEALRRKLEGAGETSP